MLSARVGDGTFGVYCHGYECCCHEGPGIISKGDDKVMVNLKPVARFGDSTIHSCPHCRTGMCAGMTKMVLSSMRPHHGLGHPIFENCGMGSQMLSDQKVIDTFS